MSDDPGLTTAEQAETQLGTARRVFATVLSQHELDRHGNDGIGLAIWACPACGTAMQAFEAAARAAVQTRVEALEEALKDALMGLAIFGIDIVPGGAGEVTRAIERGRAVLTATEQELSDADE